MQYIMYKFVAILIIIGASKLHAQYEEYKQHQQYQAEFELITHTFLQLMGRDEIRSTLSFGPMFGEKVLAAYCYRGPGQRRIVLNLDYWKQASFSQKENLMLHELGHCELDYRHSGGIMYKNVLPKDHYRKYRQVYLEIFRQGLPKFGEEIK